MTFVVDGTNGLTFNDATTQSSTATNASNISSGTLGKARLPTGSVLQVVSVTKTDSFSANTGSYIDITGLSASITPLSATSKILVISSVSLGVAAGNTFINLVRGSTNIAQSISGTANETIAANQGGVYSMQVSPNIFLDSPATTSATTYKLQINTSSQTTYVNVRATDQYYGGVSSITLMEISA